MDRKKEYSKYKSSKRSRSRSRKDKKREKDSSRDRKSKFKKDEKKQKSKNKTSKQSRSRSSSVSVRHSEESSKNSSVDQKNLLLIDKNKSNFSDNCPGMGIDPNLASQVINANPNSVQALALAQAAKADRKLYIGNLPNGITSSTLVKLLNAALLALKMNKTPGDPVLSAWISTDGHYAFVEFRTAEEANNGFALNNISILGQPLKVGRPKTYVGTLSMLDDGTLCNTVAAALQSGTMNAPLMGKKVQFPTKILCFLNIVEPFMLDDDEEFKDIVNDIREECAKFGRVMSINIPRNEVDKEIQGVGHAFLEFYTVEEAKEVRRQMSGRKFNRKTVKIIYFTEEKYAKKDFFVQEEKALI